MELLGTSVDNKKLSFLTAHKDPLSNTSAQEILDIIKADLNNYKLLLDAFICYRHRKAVRNLRLKVKKELGITNEEVKVYKIYMAYLIAFDLLLIAIKSSSKKNSKNFKFFFFFESFLSLPLNQLLLEYAHSVCHISSKGNSA